ncbi:MAG: hypothetical protein NZZ41_02655 [Candidatus Dojkabacteria bacterium]|nr:hypothetical protein [Candidatus Dojkabacteria bacterium]
MNKEFIKKVRAFLSGEPLLLTEILDWLATSQPIKNNKSRLTKYLLTLQRCLFVPNLPNQIADKLSITNDSLQELLVCYYNMDDVRDWKFAISQSVEDNTKLSYLNYKNASKYEVKVLLHHTTILFVVDDKYYEDLFSQHNIRIKAKPTSVLKPIVESLFYDDTKKQQEIIDYISYFYTNLIDASIKEVSGKEILWAYYYENYAEPSNGGTLWNSCMRHEESQKHLEIYCDNPDKISLVVAVNSSNKVLGRALLWHTPNGVYRDKIYAYNSTIENKIKDYCKEKGYPYIETDDVSIKLDHGKYRYLPYLDNMNFFTKEGIQNFDDDDVICFCKCMGEHFFYNEDYKNVNGRYYHVDDLNYSDYLEEYLLEAEEAYYAPDEFDYFPPDDVVYSSLEEVYVYVHSKSVVYLEYCGDYAFLENCVTDINDELRFTSHVVTSVYMDGYIMKDEAMYHDEVGWVTKEVFDKLVVEKV